jgi:hypothetical protein
MAMSVYVLTTAFCNAKVFCAGMESLRRTVDFGAMGAQHLVLDNHYPLHREETTAAIASYAAKCHDVLVIDAGKNLGLHEGLNHLLIGIPLADDDIVVGYDADEDPVRAGWLEAMARVFAADRTVGWLSLMAKVLEERLDHDRAGERIVGGERVRFPTTSLMNCVVGWRGAAIKAMGRMDEPHAFYGGLEGTMQPRCRSAGYSIGFMSDYWTLNHRGLADKTYELYKLRHVGHEQPHFPGSFDEWIKANP